VERMAVVPVTEPIFEADPEPEQYADRANRSASDAVGHAHGLVRAGHDQIPHAELLKSLSRRISDRHLLGLIAMWLEAPVEEIDDRGRHHRTTRNKDEGRGGPQGSPLSPLPANIYMRRFVHGWEALGHERRLRATVVDYADDLVICRRGTADEAMTAMRAMMSGLKLTVNEARTRLRRIPEETFDFPGYTIGRCYSPQTGRAYIGTRPSARVIQRVCREVSELTGRRWAWLDEREQIARLKRKLEGRANYFCPGQVREAYQAVDRHTCHRLRRWLRAKHQGRTMGYSRDPEESLHEVLGLTRLEGRRRNFPCAKA
jgi:RNA-directed DNA polymerase